MKQARLVLVRHGQSVYNKENLFTGWTDVALSPQGEKEAQDVGRLLKKNGIYPDICFTSWLKRAIHTAQIALRELEWEHIDSLRSYKLNERHYGAWQGQNKSKVLQEYGEQQFLAVRRGYDVPPPPLDENDSRVVWRDAKYATFERALLPISESLKDTKKRVVEYFQETIQKELKKDKTVFVSAHGNSLRALVMHLEQISEEDVVKLEIPTGEIIVYTFTTEIQIDKKEILLG
ncbi:2,3-bisphosphoglycerate-dependent phosphoglycerate mutase [Sulfurimonas paralvinellae]|uniref:2,3-bisphosphoglycerate-dependent phosphoglycerate mutase n=1 Tax=Sulfurimonas paralvinellae TaxID=317658 RepID=A0A7M1BAJ9_9BACT|nr:2,3-diphosphoglycerate-dependent phosphoglycerate mutase [Sulfurimonas paralvinellae]QOP45782.1 2,3-diphosphoglycerate-dependent phosphoglycerate mutase [Sulfurimonas paralvinellae]